jgi:hypothetical protein
MEQKDCACHRIRHAAATAAEIPAPCIGKSATEAEARDAFGIRLQEFMTQKSYPDTWMRSANSMCCFEHVQKLSVCAY